MKELPSLIRNKLLSVKFALTSSIALSILALFLLAIYNHRLNKISQQLAIVYQTQKTSADEAQLQYQRQLFETHLSEIQRQSLQSAKQQIEAEYQHLTSEDSVNRLAILEEIYSLYKTSLDKITRNRNRGLDTSATSSQISNWSSRLLNQQFKELRDSISQANQGLDDQYRAFLTSLPTPTTKPSPPKPAVKSAAGYSYQPVSTEVGTFNVHLIKFPLPQIQVKTVTANQDDCTTNCATKQLADYVKENNAYAGVHGTYFCPPDYNSCKGKTNSYDFAVYNFKLGKWLNEAALSWDNLGLATFNGKSPLFYKKAKSFDSTTVTAGLENFPSLLSDGKIVVDEFDTTTYQDQKGTRGAIGVDKQDIYLVIASSASVREMAYIMKKLGASNALNLDGGGSSAMYVGGSYKVGPGRPLPNAILLFR